MVSAIIERQQILKLMVSSFPASHQISLRDPGVWEIFCIPGYPRWLPVKIVPPKYLFKNFSETMSEVSCHFFRMHQAHLPDRVCLIHNRWVTNASKPGPQNL